MGAWAPSRRGVLAGAGALAASKARALTAAQDLMLLSGGSTPYLGFVATRGGLANRYTTLHPQFNTRTFHRAMVAISQLKIIIPNWYLINPGFTETAVPGSVTFTAGIEYPTGTFTQVKFSGSASATIASGGQVTSDWCGVSIPAGASFFVRLFCSSTVGILYNDPTGSNGEAENPSNGEALDVGSGLSDLTLGGTIVDNVYSFGYGGLHPLAILGMTTKPSVLIIGDSRAWGYGDTYTASNDIGEIARSIGQHFGYSNIAIPADQARYFVSGSPLRRAMAQYASHIVCEYGVNDMYVSGQTGAQTLASLASIRALFPGKPFFQSTIDTVTSSTDNWTTLANQTINASINPGAVTVNDGIRAGNGGITGFFDVANVTMSSQDSLKWNVSQGQSTVDGLHANQVGYLAVLASGVINPARFTGAL